MDQTAVNALIKSITEAVQSKVTQKFTQLSEEVKNKLESLDNKGDGETKVSNNETHDPEKFESKYDPDSAGVELLRKMMGKDDNEEENEMGDERRIVEDNIDLTKLPFPIQLQERALIMNETIMKGKVKTEKDKETSRVQRGKDLVATQWYTVNFGR